MQYTVIAGGPERNFETFDILHAFIPLSVAKLSTLKTVRFFWPSIYNRTATRKAARNA